MSISEKVKYIALPKPVALVAASVVAACMASSGFSAHVGGLGFVKRAFNDFASPEEKMNAVKAYRLRRAILYHMLHYRVSPYEYFMFGFPELDDAGKQEFIGSKECWAVLSRVGTPASREIFNNKYKADLRFCDFYKREAVPILSDKDLEAFLTFVSKHDRAIVKDLSGLRGAGVFMLDLRAPDFNAEKSFRDLLVKGPHIVEELIRQAPEMAIFHPASVNTVRYETWCENGRVTPMISFIRMGRGGSVVDNAGAGGVFASVDVKSGVVKTGGITEHGQRYDVHPDSGAAIKGFQIPRWEELTTIAELAAKSVPEQPCVAWDFALSDDGWVIVEGNARGQFVQQMCEQKGCRREIEEIIGKDRFRI